MVDRAQAHTLEAVAAAILLIGSLTFALQVTAVTPLSASTSNQHIENQQAATVEGVLERARDTGALDRAVVHWDEEEGTFHDANRMGYTTTSKVEETAFGRMLNDAFADRGIAFNVEFQHLRADGRQRSVQFIQRGQPSDNAVTRTTKVTLHGDDVLYAADESPTDRTLEAVDEEGNFYASDTSPETSIFNVIRVEVTVWRM